MAAILACLSVIAGLVFSALAGTMSGPSVVLAAGALFVLTLALPQANEAA
jgi:ABC-type Mn2+/Zn2+ transport system permease subunit